MHFKVSLNAVNFSQHCIKKIQYIYTGNLMFVYFFLSKDVEHLVFIFTHRFQNTNPEQGPF